MAFTLIKGVLNPTLGLPDGDSMRFIPNNPEPLFRLHRQKSAPCINPENGSVQLRFDAIDSIEREALDPLSEQATQSLLELADTRGGTEPSPAYIYTNQLAPDGRPVAFVFSGTTRDKDGSTSYVQADTLSQSINAHQLLRGLAYPLFYDTLYDELRDRLRTISLMAREKRIGLWSSDQTNESILWTGSVSTLPPIFPKLWRRIQSYQRNETLFEPERPFANLSRFIETLSCERVALPVEKRTTRFDNLIENTDDTMRLTTRPHDMVFMTH